MLTDFESRLADFLGSGLPAPFTGRVEVAPGPAASNQPSITVAVVEARRLAPDFGSTRPEQAPGADDPRRVVRLDCDVAIEVRAATNQGRPQAIAGLDALLYELDRPELARTPTLESPADDPGFVIESLEVTSARTAPEEGLPRLLLHVVGWFWPPDAPGITGAPIAEARVRTVARPVDLAPWPLRLRAGDGSIALTLTTSAGGTTLLDGQGVAADSFGAVAVRVIDAGGRPGAGTLAGGDSGPPGSRLIALTDGTATVEYVPPAEAATDHLVVSVARPDTGDGAEIGIELARFSIEVTA